MWAIFYAVSISLLLVSLGNAEEKSQVAPKTQLETFLGKTGHIIVKEIHSLGSVTGKSGTGLGVSTVVLFEPGSESKKQNGLKIEVKGGGKFEREASSFLDLDEVEALSQAIAYITKLAGDWEGKPRDYTEVVFSSKGDFQAGIYTSEGSVTAFASSGRIGAATAFLTVSSIQQLKEKVDAGVEFLKSR